MTFLDWDQVIGLAEAHNERYRALIYVAVDTGMRWSELVGLRRGKVDLKNRKIRVTEQLVQLEDRSFLRKEPKTAAGVRSITISPFTASLLAAHLESFAQPGPDSLVFANAAGNPLTASSFRYGHLFPELDEAIVESFDRSFHEATERRARVVVKGAFSAS